MKMINTIMLVMAMMSSNGLEFDCITSENFRDDKEKRESFLARYAEPPQGNYEGGCRIKLNFDDWEMKCIITVTKAHAMTMTLKHLMKQMAKFYEGYTFIKDYSEAEVSYDGEEVGEKYICDLKKMEEDKFVKVLDGAVLIDSPHPSNFVDVGEFDTDSDSFWRGEFKEYEQVESNDL